jgi:uncharacterized protein (DUF1800 family)
MAPGGFVNFSILNRIRSCRPAAVRLRWLAATGLLSLASCGGGGGGPDTSEPLPATPENRVVAARLLTQATFGSTPTEVDRVLAQGIDAWINTQMATPATSNLAFWRTLDAANQITKPGSVSRDEVYFSFWHTAVTAPDQLRQRVAYALAQIFVISMRDDGVNGYPDGAANYLDTLSAHAFGNYRELLEAVALHPMMGLYLSHLHNQKGDLASGRVPDENFAREIMQLFSIGLQELNADGTARSGSNGSPLETYTAADISGLANVFTGWSWACGSTSNACFYSGGAAGSKLPDRATRPMQAYPAFHATSAKLFLGTSIASQTSPDPQASLKVALDRLFQHPNVGPFVGRQLIQRLVTSNPSPAYVGRVAAAFADNGVGVRGDMKAVIKAVLLDPEARAPGSTDVAVTQFGKLREPVLRLSAALRAFGAHSASGQWRIGNTDDPGFSLGQTVLRAPSVFNFYRPGYVPPGSAAGALGLTVPEMQITDETSVAGYANSMSRLLGSGVGDANDVQLDLSALTAVADQPAALVALVGERLMGGQMPAELAALIEPAVASIALPTGTALNVTTMTLALANRARLAVYLTLVSPEFIVQK